MRKEQNSRSKGLLERIVQVCRRPRYGPFLFGVVVGGLPLGVGFAFLGRQVISPEILWFVVALAPWGIWVTCVGTVLGKSFSWLGLLGRTMLISLGSWVVPFGVCWGLAWWAGEDVFSGKNVGVLAGIFWIWAVVLAVPCWVAAMGYVRLKRREG
jgi:hypothetical protein